MSSARPVFVLSGEDGAAETPDVVGGEDGGADAGPSSGDAAGDVATDALGTADAAEDASAGGDTAEGGADADTGGADTDAPLDTLTSVEDTAVAETDVERDAGGDAADTMSDVDVVDAEAVDTTPAPAPVVTWVTVADDTIAPGSPLSLAWTTTNAATVRVAASSGVVPAASLAACTEVDAEGGGSCDVTVLAAAEPEDVLLSVVAVNADGAESEPETATVTLGLRPNAELTVTPSVLPETGGEAALSWSTPGAARVVVVRDDDAIVVDTDAGTPCDGGLPCGAAGDAIGVAVTEGTTWTVLATNDFGDAAATATARLEGAPRIEALSIDGADALGGGQVGVDSPTAELAWTVAELQASDALTLEEAPLAEPHGSCAATDEAAWMPVEGFSGAGAATGAALLTGLDETATCFRFTALDLDAASGQRDLAIFEVYRIPEVVAFDVDDDTIVRGEPVALSWDTRFAYDVAVTVSPIGAVTAQDLAGCTAPSGDCTVTVQPGTPLGEIRFDLVASGEDGATSAPVSAAATVGSAPAITHFASDPGSTATATEVVLSWQADDAARLVLRQGDATLLDTTAPATVASGTYAAGSVAATRTWRLVASNAFGESAATTTTFVGPSIDTLTLAGQSALGGEVVVPTGPLTAAWTTTSADGPLRLELGPVPDGEDCAGATLPTVFADDAPPPASSYALGFVTANRCVRLRVANGETPPRTSAATFLLREVPDLRTVTRTPASISSSGGVVIVSAKIRGARHLDLTASYLAADGEVLGAAPVCDETSLNSGALSDSGADDQVQCAHPLEPCSLLCLNGGMPGGTARVRYHLTVEDGEGDGASWTSTAETDVTVD